MKSFTKRTKTHNFENDAEAAEYVHDLLKGTPTLPRDLWIQILSSNPQLSVQDIQAMCRVNKAFQELCDSGLIWDKIFQRQFGLEKWKEWKEWDEEYLQKYYPGINYPNIKSSIPLLKLMTARVLFGHDSSNWMKRSWKLRTPSGWFVMYTAPGVSAPANSISIRPVFHFTVAVPLYFDRGDSTRITQRIRAVIQRHPDFTAVVSRLADSTFLILHQDLHDSFTRSESFESAVIFDLLSTGARTGSNLEFVGCTLCSAPALFTCKGCTQTFYCGETCASSHWVSSHFKDCEKKLRETWI